jgi:hypothetical protein
MPKGIDIKMGLDIASVAYKKQADQMVLVAGDADSSPQPSSLGGRESTSSSTRCGAKSFPAAFRSTSMACALPQQVRLSMRERAQSKLAEKEKASPAAATDAETGTADAGKITRLF